MAITLFSYQRKQADTRELKQQRLWRLRKRHWLKNFKLCRANYSTSLISSNVGKFFWSWILTDCIKVQEKKENCCLVFMFSIKRKTTKFHDVVVQLRRKNGQKSVMHVQSSWFANLNLLVFHRSLWRRRRRRRRRCLSSLILYLSPCQLCIRLSLLLNIMSTGMACYYLYKQELNKLYRHTCRLKDLTRVVQTSDSTQSTG